SGMRFGPITDDVRSLEIVGSGGALYRIEPADGITDADVFERERPEWQLLQDDDAFNAARVGMGCLGVIYSVTLAVRAKFYLREVRTLTKWEDARAQLLRLLADNEHCELYFNPYRRDGGHDCLITTRNEVSEQQYEQD